MLVDQAAEGVTVQLDPLLISDREHRIIGCNYGSCRPHVDFPRILNLYATGTLDLDSMITRRLVLEQINDAFDAIRAGESVRTLVIHGD